MRIGKSLSVECSESWKHAESKLDPPSGQNLVTVIVGVYNHEAFVESCLDSVAANNYRNLEIIVFNDASKDSSDEIVRSWIGRHPSLSIRYICHTQNVGLTRSLNEAVSQAKGTFICWLSADDLMLPRGIEDRVRYLERHPSKLAVFADCNVIDKDGRQLYTSGIEGLHRRSKMIKEVLKIDELIPYNIVFHWAVPGPVFMCRPETFSVVGPYDESLVIEDWDMYLRIAAAKRLGFVNSLVASYRFHPGNTMKNIGQRLEDDLADSARKNRWRIGGLGALYLSGVYYQKRVRYSRTTLSRFYWRAISKSLRETAPRLYYIRRALILRRYAGK